MSQLSARIEPFRGLIYDLAKIADLSAVVAPPYDLIGPSRQKELYERSPVNVVRLELNRERDPYAAAARMLEDWTRDGILRRATKPAIFLYSQEFEVSGRHLTRYGFMARVRLEEFSQGRILPHERTFAAAKEDRLRLISATRANLSPIFGLYSGKHAAVDQLREQTAEQPPMFDVVDDLGIRNRLWPVEGAADIATLQRALEKPRVLIADGHHRYETALNYRRLRRAEENDPAPQPYDYVMMSLCATDDPGLVILPTHRQVADLPGARATDFERAAGEFFVVNRVPNRVELLDSLQHSGRGSLAVALRGSEDLLLLKLRDSTAMAAAAPNLPSEIRELDVSVLHVLVFERLLGLTESMVKAGGKVEYKIDANAVLDAVSGGQAAGAFLMNPPTIKDVERVSDAGVTMPEKSTYFYPKLLTGLVLNPLDE